MATDKELLEFLCGLDGELTQIFSDDDISDEDKEHYKEIRKSTKMAIVRIIDKIN